MMHGKKSESGQQERRNLIVREYGDRANELIEGLRTKYPKKSVGDDDIHDAFAALWSAERLHENRSIEVPSRRTLDRAGLPMRIVY